MSLKHTVGACISSLLKGTTPNRHRVIRSLISTKMWRLRGRSHRMWPHCVNERSLPSSRTFTCQRQASSFYRTRWRDCVYHSVCTTASLWYWWTVSKRHWRCCTVCSSSSYWHFMLLLAPIWPHCLIVVLVVLAPSLSLLRPSLVEALTLDPHLMFPCWHLLFYFLYKMLFDRTSPNFTSHIFWSHECFSRDLEASAICMISICFMVGVYAT